MVKIGLRFSPLLITYMILAAILTQIIIRGNDYIARAMDLVLTGEEVQLDTFLLPLLGMIILGTAVAFGKSISGNYYSALVQRELRGTLAEHLLDMPFCYFDEKGSGSIMTKLSSDIGDVGNFFSEILPDILVNLITIISVTTYFVQMDGMLIVILFASYPVMLVVADKLSKKLAEIAKRYRSKMDERTQIAYDAIQGIVVGRSYNLYDVIKRRIDVAIDDIADNACKSTRISSMAWVLKSVLTTIPVVICYLFALHETMTNRITVGDMLAFTVLLGRIIYPIGDLVFCVNEIRTVGVSCKRLQEIYEVVGEQESQNAGQLYSLEEKDAMDDSAPAITWKDVRFSYQAERKILKGLSFEINQGETVAFAGGSGEGKSTIFRLLLGFYTKTGGEMLLFGKETAQWNVKELRKCFSYVSQNVFLLPQSIFQNVACGKENATKEEVIAACKAANIHDFIMSLPNGYDTVVGERGARLSGGERQRISIARAYLKAAPILLLDEPTAAVDAGTESEIQEALANIAKGKTVVVIAHRLSTIKHSDRIYIVNKGQVAEAGTHEELLALNGIYAGMYGKEVAADAE